MEKKYRNIFFTAVALLVSVVALSQNRNKDSISQTKKDTIVPLKYNFKSGQKGSLFLNNPTKTEIIYDKKLRKFVLVEKIGKYRIGTPIFMSPAEYDKYRLKNDIKGYFKEKTAIADGKSTKKDGRKNLLPKYYVNSKFFESIFGGNEVEVIPTGQVSIKLGGVYQKTENPQISVENQSNFTFDFDQQISAGLQAKVGKRLKVTANYDTQSTFDFQNVIKLEYTPSEDDILQKLDAGNINMPIKNSLINGAQALFGVRADFQFGKTTIRTAFSQQNSQTKTVVAKGGAVIEPFEFRATDYDNDRHFFLSQFFRETYNKSLENYPLISSPIKITRVEVWVTNQNQNVKDYRSIVALADLGETNFNGTTNNTVGTVTDKDIATANVGGLIANLPSNKANNLNDLLTETGGIRDVSTLSNTLNTTPYNMVQGQNYSYLQNARKLQPNEYRLHSQLGYISLNRRLNDGEVLAVAFEYTVVGASNGESVFKVGEFSNDGVNAPANIAVKLLRSEILTTSKLVGSKKTPFPTWNLMMKNIYPLGAFPLQQEGFRFELLYRDDDTGVLLNTLQGAKETSVRDRTLLNLLNLDKLDQSQYAIPNGDGFFDFVEGITVVSERGYIIFPETEPFGTYIENTLTNPLDKQRYSFKELYLTTKAQAKNEYQNKDKFFLKGYYKSETSRGISLGAFNIPRGSVRVTAGGRQLVEGVDYVVDYQLGRVQILDPGLEASGIPINARVENNTFFNQQRKTFIGIDIEHKVSENFVLGGTFLNVSEKPITPKVNFGGEPINNIMLGLNVDYSTEVPYFTKLANKLPFVETDVPSNLSVRADMAYFLPGTPSGIDINGTATSYLDDFESSQIPISLSSPQQWHLASTPISQGLQGNSYDIHQYNDKRAKLAWYNIDQLFYTSSSNRPGNINDVELSREEVRQVRYSELFPNTDLDITQLNLVRTLDLAYYPSERGPYNYNTSLGNAEGNWAGIMRSLTTNNFEQANVEYIQFWLKDPYENYSITEKEGLPSGVNPNDNTNRTGKLLINLGNLSEDILRDARKQYENGLSTSETPSPMTDTPWGKVPVNPSILYAFSNKNGERSQQDVGLDGLNDEEEKAKYPAFAGENDPAGDNFQFFRGGNLDAINASILTRYKNYNGTDGNSPTPDQSGESYPTSSSAYPDTEDINRDQTMNTVSAYFEYEVSMNKSDFVLGKNHIVDVKETTITLPNGESRQTKWYQFRIPVRSGYSKAVGGITDFNSIRFMRIFLTEFKIPVVLRFGELELVRGDWRRYAKTLDPKIVPQVDLTSAEINKFEVGVVSIEQNEKRYVLPPGISREQLQGTNRIQRQNEQSISLKVNDLPQDNIRAVFKNISIDMRRYKTLQMFMHAENNINAVRDNEMVAIIRLGTDLNDNYYQIEKPLIVSKKLSYPSSLEAWPEENNLKISLTELANIKLLRDGAGVSAATIYNGTTSNGLKISVKGNPTLAQVRTVMLGVKNTAAGDKTAELWFNELRAVGFDNKGGWATVINANTNFADVADVSLAGRISTVGFGDVENRVQERSIEEVKQYNVATNVQLGKIITPKKWGLQIPMSYTYGEEFKDPKYNPQYKDVEQAAALNSGSDIVRKNAKNAQDYTRRKGISFINVKKNRNPESKKTPKFYDVENLALSYSFNEEYHRDYNIKKFINQNLMVGASYSFNFKPWSIEPFKKSEKLKGKYWKFIRDININPVPKLVSINSKFTRSYNTQQSRNLLDIGLSEQPELTQRRFLFDWDYTIGFDLTKSLQLNFNATNNYIYDNFGRDEKLEIYDKLFTIGRSDHYHQKLNATYKVPINKIPYLGFITSTNYGYDADFDWKASSRSPITQSGATGNIEQKMGNKIQNANTHKLTTNIDFKRFYKTIGLEKLLLKGTRKNNSKQVSQKYRLKKNASFGQKMLKGMYDILTSVKRLKINYSQSNKTLLDGFKPNAGFLGRDSYGGGFAPTLGFVFGSQTDIMNRAIENNWLVVRDPNNVNDIYYNKSYGKTKTDKIDYNIAVRPLKNLTIDFRGNRIKTTTLTQQLDVLGDYNATTNTYENRRINNNLKTFETGNYSISHAMIGTVFSNNDALFNKFLQYRSTISNRLSSKTGLPNTASAGYQVSGQQAMLPAFVAAYSGFNPNSTSTDIFRKIPIPNWTLRYNGFMKNKWIKKRFSSFTLSHGYKSSYTIGNFTNNSQYDANNPSLTNISGNYQPKTLISQAVLIDEFSPLVRLDMRMKNSFSVKGAVKTDRSLTLNLNNNTITDVKGTEYIIGFGYKIKDVKFVTRFTGRRETIKGDINLRADLSFRNNLTLIRSIDKDNNQITGGETLFGLKFIADYNLNKNLTASVYYNHNTFEYAISTTFPRQSINAGINIIYNIGN